MAGGRSLCWLINWLRKNESLTAHQKGTTARWYSNKTSLSFIWDTLIGNWLKIADDTDLLQIPHYLLLCTWLIVFIKIVGT